MPPITVVGTGVATRADDRTAVVGLVEWALAGKRADPQADLSALKREIDERA